MAKDIDEPVLLSTSSAIGTSRAPELLDTSVGHGRGILVDTSAIPSTDYQALISVIEQPNLAPKTSIHQSIDTDTQRNLEEIERLLSQSSSSDASRLLGRLLVELGAQQRREALDSRLISRSIARAELEAGADELRQAAKKTEKGALMSMVLTIVGSTISIAAGVMSLQASAAAMRTGGAGSLPTGNATTPGNRAMERTPDVVAQDALTSRAYALKELAGITNQLVGSAAQYTKSTFDAGAQVDQATQGEFQAEAEVTKSEGEVEASEQQALHEFVSQMIRFIKEQLDAEVEQQAAVTRG